MARYKVLERSYIDFAVREPGAEIEVGDEFVPGPHLEPLDKAGRAASAKVGKLIVPSDPAYVLALIAAQDAEPATGVAVDAAGVVRATQG